jgi:2,4-dienoyl-CoA reductase (NADPH2)
LEQSTAAKLRLGQKAVLYPGRALLSPFFTPGFLRRVTRFWMPLDKRVVILGGGIVGCELAVFLSERSREVTILENGDQIASEMSLPMQWMTQDKLEKSQVAILTGVKFERIQNQEIEITTKEGVKRTFKSGNIIVALGTVPDSSIPETFRDCAPEVYQAGDCAKLSYIKDSVAGGYTTACNIK